MNTPMGDHIQWMGRRHLAHSTAVTRRFVLATLEDRAGGVLEASRDDIERMLDERCPWGPTRNLWIAHLNAFYQWAVDEEILERSPMRRVPRAVVGEPLPRPIPEPALALLLSRAEGRGHDRMATWITLGAFGGLRVAEIANLRREHFSLETNELRVEQGKRRKDRIVPMHPRVAARVAELTCTGRLWDVTPNNVSNSIRLYMARAGQPYSAHNLRHRFATVVYRATGDINIVRELLGHKSNTTTQIYTQVSSDRMQSAVLSIA